MSLGYRMVEDKGRLGVLVEPNWSAGKLESRLGLTNRWASDGAPNNPGLLGLSLGLPEKGPTFEQDP